MTVHISVQINQPGDEVLKKYPNLFKLSDHPSGARFYLATWPSATRGTVELIQPEGTFTLRFVLNVSGSYSANFPSENIVEWNVNAGLDDSGLIGHDAARRRFLGILQEAHKAGWSRWISPNDPRLKGINALHYMRNVLAVYGLDPEYELSLDQWMTLPSRATWRFKSKSSYLDISITRDLSRSDPNQPGAYFVEYALVSENERLRGMVGPDKRAAWKAELPQQLAKMQAARLKKEEQLKISGISIDENYQDAPLLDIKR